MEESAITLLELQRMVREGLEDLFPEEIWITAEVASVQIKGGHCYMELSQSGPSGLVAKARATIWRARYLPIAGYFREATGDDIKPGINIMVRASVSYHELYGFSLSISEVEPQFTLGEAEVRKQRTIARLKESGKMDQQKELSMPELPRRLAVISSAEAAGYGDFCRHLTSNEYGFQYTVELFPAIMQGESAPKSIADAIGAVEDSCALGGEPFDALLIIRGGGSVLDLACFDEYLLCAAIADCPVPVFTAIGHDRDFHVADMVACGYVKTPTAMADLFIDTMAAEDERICRYASRLRLAFASRVAAMEQSTQRAASRIRQALAGKILLQESRLEHIGKRISAADPRAVLARGYTLVTDSSGVIRKAASDFCRGDRIDILFPDGKLICKVEDK